MRSIFFLVIQQTFHYFLSKLWWSCGCCQQHGFHPISYSKQSTPGSFSSWFTSGNLAFSHKQKPHRWMQDTWRQTHQSNNSKKAFYIPTPKCDHDCYQRFYSHTVLSRQNHLLTLLVIDVWEYCIRLQAEMPIDKCKIPAVKHIKATTARPLYTFFNMWSPCHQILCEGRWINTPKHDIFSSVAEQNRHRKKNNPELLPSSSQSTKITSITYLHTCCRKAVPKSARKRLQSRSSCPFRKTSDDHRLLMVSSFHQNVAVRRSRCH